MEGHPNHIVQKLKANTPGWKETHVSVNQSGLTLSESTLPPPENLILSCIATDHLMATPGLAIVQVRISQYDV